MSEQALSPRADEVLDNAEEAYQQHREEVLADPYYPALHLAPPVGRLNDPNGLIYKDGIYHAFYQYAPAHPSRDIFWRHAQSADLVHWEDGPNALAPTHWYDRNGCYSGSAYLAQDGNVELFYTGNVKNEDGSRETYQNLAFTSDFENFEKSNLNPLISGTPAGYTPHFRDPYVYERDGLFYAMLGARREDDRGAIVLYSSSDRRSWNFEGELEFSDPQISHYGYMLECPQIIQLQDQLSGELKDLMIFCPQGMEAEGEKYNNKYQCGYIVGRLEGTYFQVETPFTELDAGFEFYAPQVFHGSADTKRALIAAWFGISDQDDMPSWEKHWLHLFTLPRWISLRGGRIFQQPAQGLDSALPLTPTEIGEDGALAELHDARVFRLAGELDLTAGPIKLLISDEEGEAFSIEFDQEKVTADRSGSRYTVWGPVRRRHLQEPKDSLTFDLLVDASALELFIDKGQLSLSGRSYFHGSRREIRLLDSQSQPVRKERLNLSIARLTES